MSSLAAQLAGIASIDASRLTSRTGAPSSKSYLFTPLEASNQDFDEVYQIALEGFLEIINLDPDMTEFEEELFSDISKRTDRMMLNQEDNRVLDEALGRCLRRLGKWIGVMACGKCIEWLVRRFR
jgi:U3 small nucleolar RNA-associated protein 10